MKKIYILLFAIMATTQGGSQPPGGGGPGGPCPPFSPCWCAEHPGHPNCAPAVPIDDYLPLLVLVGAALGIYAISKNQKQPKTEI